VLTGLLVDVEIFPAFDYARQSHTTTVLHPVHDLNSDESKAVTFHSKDVKLQLDVCVDKSEKEGDTGPKVAFKKVKLPGMLGEGVVARIDISEGQAVSFIVRNDLPNHITKVINTGVLDSQQHDTQSFWSNWLSKSTFKGRWREVVNRSLMILKLLTYEPTGAILAAPTFSIPEDVGGTRYAWQIIFVCGQTEADLLKVIGTIATRGCVTQALPFTSCFEWGTVRRQTRIWSS
jgi:hypothetical protein